LSRVSLPLKQPRENTPLKADLARRLDRLEAKKRASRFRIETLYDLEWAVDNLSEEEVEALDAAPWVDELAAEISQGGSEEDPL
jgi:hypothetical protein